MHKTMLFCDIYYLFKYNDKCSPSAILDFVKFYTIVYRNRCFYWIYHTKLPIVHDLMEIWVHLGGPLTKMYFFRQNINFRGRGRSENSLDYTMHPRTVQIGLQEREIIGEILQCPELTWRREFTHGNEHFPPIATKDFYH